MEVNFKNYRLHFYLQLIRAMNNLKQCEETVKWYTVLLGR